MVPIVPLGNSAMQLFWRHVSSVLGSAHSCLNNVQLSTRDCNNGTRPNLPNCALRVAFLNYRIFNGFFCNEVTKSTFVTGQMKILQLWNFRGSDRLSFWLQYFGGKARAVNCFILKQPSSYHLAHFTYGTCPETFLEQSLPENLQDRKIFCCPFSFCHPPPPFFFLISISSPPLCVGDVMSVVLRSISIHTVGKKHAC